RWKNESIVAEREGRHRFAHIVFALVRVAVSPHAVQATTVGSRDLDLSGRRHINAAEPIILRHRKRVLENAKLDRVLALVVVVGWSPFCARPLILLNSWLSESSSASIRLECFVSPCEISAPTLRTSETSSVRLLSCAIGRSPFACCPCGGAPAKLILQWTLADLSAVIIAKVRTIRPLKPVPSRSKFSQAPAIPNGSDRPPRKTTSLLAGTTLRRRKIGTRRHTRSLHGPLAARGTSKFSWCRRLLAGPAVRANNSDLRAVRHAELAHDL